MEEEKKDKSKTIIIIISVLLILLIAIGIAFYLMVKVPEEKIQQNPTIPQEDNTPTTQTNAKYIRIGPIFKLDQFIVNLANQNGRRYLKVNVELEMTTKELENELTSKRAPIRDIIIDILSSKSAEEIGTTRGRYKTKDEITQRLNEILVDGKIRNTFLTDMAVQ
ncbi:flagellar basal body-associated FliL family protein [Helicobacter sp. MIT 14-3879]|uniref:flagellar basal body-associated FliL family protein n=1 Tax=Helicobacter sp. MIT 14-3879 TaxID=2040649 RepID=UPI000E1EEDBC|nr:flagellar basal body-associated FliL family protein [Helicobacter sp. MIT 14-3879]RDU65202.1 flagellar basal body protein FliL [Helicobacter sp. MIT 14-3879]